MLWMKTQSGTLVNLEQIVALGVHATGIPGAHTEYWVQVQGPTAWTVGGQWPGPYRTVEQATAAREKIETAIREHQQGLLDFSKDGG